MCEQFVAFAPEPFRIDRLWPLTERLERFGLAGFGWGASWLGADGSLHEHRDTAAFRDDPARIALGEVMTMALLVHLRRPTRFSTIGLPDTQPFTDPAGRYAFSHNGDFERDGEHRAAFRDAGRLAGRADSEVGARWLEDHWADAGSAAASLTRLHATFGGRANLAVVARAGEALHYAGNDENPVFRFELDGIGVACTGMYSLDRSLFTYVAPGAAHRSLVPPGEIARFSLAGA